MDSLSCAMHTRSAAGYQTWCPSCRAVNVYAAELRVGDAATTARALAEAVVGLSILTDRGDAEIDGIADTLARKLAVAVADRKAATDALRAVRAARETAADDDAPGVRQARLNNDEYRVRLPQPMSDTPRCDACRFPLTPNGRCTQCGPLVDDEPPDRVTSPDGSTRSASAREYGR